MPSTSGNLPSIQNLIQMPEKAPNLKRRQGRNKQHATILTSTPIKDVLIDKENKRKVKAEKTKGKGIEKKSKLQKDNIKRVKKKILQENTSTSDVNTDDLCQDGEDDDAEGANNMCIVCGEFGQDSELWYRCTSCGLWAHADCTGRDSASNYVCDMC
ncbi:PHD finger protein ALFIN-LIKE 6-like [Agrilus planipennis]|uniref:PHD finger protein ALFIN-LIKE 6-like n=1 Tax=Agrilus planipennis TaxID=224129 RepID=A0A1W4X9N5_AGRPL|nr:PHD finger protein ALFIN-LIKE 6-like [Agrilus planipennis]